MWEGCNGCRGQGFGACSKECLDMTDDGDCSCVAIGQEWKLRYDDIVTSNRIR